MAVYPHVRLNAVDVGILRVAYATVHKYLAFKSALDREGRELELKPRPWGWRGERYVGHILWPRGAREELRVDVVGGRARALFNPLAHELELLHRNGLSR